MLYNIHDVFLNALVSIHPTLLLDSNTILTSTEEKKWNAHSVCGNIFEYDLFDIHFLNSPKYFLGLSIQVISAFTLSIYNTSNDYTLTLKIKFKSSADIDKAVMLIERIVIKQQKNSEKNSYKFYKIKNLLTEIENTLIIIGAFKSKSFYKNSHMDIKVYT
ncbi:MAG: hypothetical protein ACK4HE_11135 [Chitinophagaceae bacterium]